ncbi:hypothetical protein QAD02_024027 [Eretmocerus hayati]|uniref:Uncharacterized protein n=1 Tax=Eretmocerus hayati TaxID=131215 RepID=A0ACC2PXV8_9HYME|nr:hypothetical protein QAD02_024027 [Eretmocerus hayati]
MSKSLVKKSLELVSDDLDVKKDKRKRRKVKSSGALDLIPANHRLVTKGKRKDILQRSSEVTVYQAKKSLQSKVDPTEENVQRLLHLSNNRLDSEASEKLLNRARNRRYIVEEEKPVEEERTVFTEEDFKKFEAEYAG